MKHVFCAFVFAWVLFSAAEASAAVRCAASRAVGLSESDVTAIEDVVCAAARERAEPGVGYWIRLARLGDRIVLTLIADREGAAPEETQLVLANVDEVAVAAPRLVEALAEKKHVVETQTVDNVVAAEARAPKKKAAEMHAMMGVVGIGVPGGSSQGGAHFAFLVGSSAVSFVFDLRLAGDAAGDVARRSTLGIVDVGRDAKLGLYSAASGVRHHFTNTDTSPFVGVGLALDSISMFTDHTQENTGLAGTAEAGLDFLRASTFGGSVAVRLDLPAFALRGTRRQTDRTLLATQTWVPVVGASFSMRF